MTNAIDDFKVGDKVEVTTNGLLEDRYYELCVITKVFSYGYNVECPSGDNKETFVQGLTNLVLSLYSQDGTNVDGIFTFHLGDGENMTFLGSFKMIGTYDQKTGSLDLKGVDWNQKPADYLIADLSGTVSQSGLNISGNVTKQKGCGTFNVERIKF